MFKNQVAICADEWGDVEKISSADVVMDAIESHLEELKRRIMPNIKTLCEIKLLQMALEDIKSQDSVTL